MGPIRRDPGWFTQDTASSGDLFGTDLTMVYTLLPLEAIKNTRANEDPGNSTPREGRGSII